VKLDPSDHLGHLDNEVNNNFYLFIYKKICAGFSHGTAVYTYISVDKTENSKLFKT